MSLSGKITLVKRWIGILSGKNRVAVEQGAGKHYSKEKIAGYYNDLTGKVNEKTLLDEYGIPINRIEGDKLVYFPISIFQYALGLWDLYLEDSSELRKNQFLVQCEWIIESQSENGSWNCFGPIGYKKLTVSSMGQGEAISVLLRAWTLTGDEKWKVAAGKAVNFMQIPIESGGTLLRKGNDYFLEEYADLEGTKRSVLNGWIFSLFGLYDWLKVSNDPETEKIYKQSLDTLTRHINDYDNGYWTLYDKTGRIASPAYHDLHIALLKVMSDITGDDLFAGTAKRWEGYAGKSLNRIRAIAKKAFQKFHESPEGIIIQ